MPRTRVKTPRVEAPAGKRLKLKWVISQNCTPAKQRLVVKGLGFTRLNQIVERVDNESIRGMVKAIPHLVRILES